MIMDKIYTIFFGTHDLAVTVLQELIKSEYINIDLVITQPDRPVGRKKIMTPPPVKVFAEKHGIHVEQPRTLKNYNIVKSKDYQIAILTEYGVKIPDKIINTFTKGILNIHYSLLPKYRGASPIQSAILNGDTETGVSIMLLEKSLDTGPVIAQKTYRLYPDEMYENTKIPISKLGVKLLIDILPKYLSGEVKPKPQNNKNATLCHQLSRDDGRIDWNNTTTKIYNQYRALTPWPGIWTIWRNKRIKLLKIIPADRKITPGKVETDNDTLYIGTNTSSIKIIELQIEGKNVMNSNIFLQGNKIEGYQFL